MEITLKLFIIFFEFFCRFIKIGGHPKLLRFKNLGLLNFMSAEKITKHGFMLVRLCQQDWNN